MLEQIRSFLTVVEEGSLHRAAARLRISQGGRRGDLEDSGHVGRRGRAGGPLKALLDALLTATPKGNETTKASCQSQALTS